MNKQLSQQIDALRGISALVVLLAHTCQIFIWPITGLSSPWRYVASIGASYAVLTFFVLSGFVITGAILRDHSRGGFRCTPYLISRASRIYPPLLFSIALCLAIYGIVYAFDMHGKVSFRTEFDLYVAREKMRADSIRVYLWNLLFLQNVFPQFGPITMNGPLWSLSYEVWLYIIAMFSANWVLNNRVLLGAAPLGVILYVLYVFSDGMFLFLATVWGIGAVAGILYANRVTVPPTIAWPAAALLAAIALREIILDKWVLSPYSSVSAHVVQLLVVTAGLLLFVVTWKRLGFLSWLKGTGAYSYTLYICHFPLLLFAFSLFHETFMTAGLGERALILSGTCVAIILFCKLVSGPLEDKQRYADWLRGCFYRGGTAPGQKESAQMT